MSLRQADAYRAIYITIWKLNERHYTRGHGEALNDNWSPERCA